MVFQSKIEVSSQGQEDAHLNTKLPGVFEVPRATSGPNGYKTKACGKPVKEGELSHLEAVQEKCQHKDEKSFLGIDDVGDQ